MGSEYLKERVIEDVEMPLQYSRETATQIGWLTVRSRSSMAALPCVAREEITVQRSKNRSPGDPSAALHPGLSAVLGRRDSNKTAEGFREMTLIRKTGSHT